MNEPRSAYFPFVCIWQYVLHLQSAAPSRRNSDAVRVGFVWSSVNRTVIWGEEQFNVKSNRGHLIEAIQKLRMLRRGDEVPSKVHKNVQGEGGSSKNVRTLR